jgi:hypothetical protein
MQPVGFPEARLFSGIGLPGALNWSDKYNSLSRLIRSAARYDKFKTRPGAGEHRKFLVKTARTIINCCRPNICSLYVHLIPPVLF